MNKLKISIFIILVIGIASSLYYSALKIDYVWRWYRIPQYFVYHDLVEIKAEITGEIESIQLKDEKAVIRVTGDGESESYTVPTSDIRLFEGDLISPSSL